VAIVISDNDYKNRWGTESVKNAINTILGTAGHSLEIIAFPFRFYGEYQISIIDFNSGGTPPSVTSTTTHVFNYEEKKWVCTIGNNIRWAHSMGENAFSTTGAQIYEYTPESTELSFHGTVASYSVSLYVNDAATLVKKWLNMAIQSEQAWAVEISTYGNINGPSMTTDMLPANFKQIEQSRWVAGIKKDKTDPNFTSQLLALLNGRDMRGNYALVTLTGQTAASKVFLFSVKCNVIPSNPIP